MGHTQKSFACQRPCKSKDEDSTAKFSSAVRLEARAVRD